MKLEFLKNFLWGSATSAHQVEGNNHNDWSEWEKATGHEESGRACDHYNRFREDFDIAKSLNQNAHRFSIEWSRIEPEEGKWNEKEIAHYQEVIDALRERGIEPFVTLWHWTLPIWAAKQGGWENKKTIDDFVRYVDKIVRSLSADKAGLKSVAYWITINEPGTFIGLSYIQGNRPPQIKNLFRANRVFKNLMVAQRLSYDIIHQIDSGAQVGTANYVVHMIPYKNLPWNWLLVKILDYIRNWRFLNAMRGSLDFIGINYYHTDIINLKLGKGRWGPIELKNLNDWTSDMDWWIYPEGIYHLLKRAAQYKRPVYITENGVADAKDIHREKFIKKHLKYVHKAISEGVDVRGYFYWSLLDNFEWDDGFEPKFGLVEVDYKTLERKIRPSAYAYEQIIKENTLTI